MPAAVCFDASTLINFAEAQAIVLLAKHFRGRSYVAGEVELVELAKTVLRGVSVFEHVGVRWIERVDIAGAKDLARVERLQSQLGSSMRHRGEAESIVICEDRNAIFAADDDGALRVARSRGIRTVTTAAILNQLVARNHLARADAFAIASRMQAAGQHVDPGRID